MRNSRQQPQPPISCRQLSTTSAALSVIQYLALGAKLLPERGSLLDDDVIEQGRDIAQIFIDPSGGNPSC